MSGDWLFTTVAAAEDLEKRVRELDLQVKRIRAEVRQGWMFSCADPVWDQATV